MKPLRIGILALSILALGATAGFLLLWLLGVAASDRFAWSQRLSFVPRQFLVWPAGVAWVCFASLSIFYDLIRPRAEGMPWRSERRGRSRLPRIFRAARATLGVLTLAATAHLLLLDWRWPVNLDARPLPPGERLRIVHWNVGWSHPQTVFGAIADREPDLAIVVNPMTRSEWSWDFQGLAATLGGGGRIIRDWPINVVSRFPIRRWGVTELGFTSPVSVDAEFRTAGAAAPLDPGHAMFVELELDDATANALGAVDATVVVWILDLPSDPDLRRPHITRQARERIGMWLGPNGEGFPEPDVMIGDFNIPRGSASLATLRTRPGAFLADAHAQGGLGADASWPAHRPLFHIDQCFVRAPLRAAWYAVQDGGDGRHRMQVVDLIGE